MAFFDYDQQRQLDTARKKVESASATIAYCVYENPFARSGGIYAVSINYTKTLEASGR
ncbi:MAG: hypothetical protein GY792_05965, partial [Gammaproteobacteria bacterium]|nr:hypothetical protein [Gammaproteobacteria bacterium]